MNTIGESMMGINNWKLHKRALCTALGMCMAVSMAPAAMAQSNVDGSVAGHTEANATVTITNPATGYTRTTHANASGEYRISRLPVGNYTLSAKHDGTPVGSAVGVSIDIGRTTLANVSSGGTAGQTNATNLGSVVVAANAIAPIVDVNSTEASAMNISREQLQRIPVERSVSAVTLLAPGVEAGHTSFGGLSFGGSSIAENAFYVNGLNVTDFYNRNGFSEAPYAFYQQFQVKTGGYSVKYGRTTGGVVNTVVRSGTNQFHFGLDFNLEPDSWQSVKHDHYDESGRRYYTASRDQHSLVQTDVWASGPIVKDKLFFFALYEARGNDPRNTNDAGNSMTLNDSHTGFWGVNLDWNITDRNTLSLMAFSDKNKNVGDSYAYDYDTDTLLGDRTGRVNSFSGGRNWALTWNSYFTDNLSMRLMYGRNKRESYSYSDRDMECNYVSVSDSVMSEYDPGVQTGCASNASVYKRNDTRKQYRADFEWDLGNHVLSFGYDHENDTSVSDQHYTGPGQYYYNVWYGVPGDTIENGATIPAGYDAYVRQRQYAVGGTFPTINSAFYIQDDWHATPNLLISIGLRNDSFDNEDAEGRSYMKIDRQLAPRLGFSWDMKGDGTTKLFGNLGRYYLPVANVINIKQAGGLLDRRTYYAFEGWNIQEIDGTKYAVPKLGAQLGAVDDSQGDGTVGDLRSEVDHDIDPVYQDELILGFQQMLTDKWSWGVSGTYRRLHRAIDDMDITATPQCGNLNGGVGWVMANPGTNVTVWGDSDCDGTNDSYITIDTSKEGWAKYDSDGNYLGQTGWHKPKRSYTALEFQIDRAWDDKWSFNATYVLSWSRGNAEGPVNSDTNFADTGRTENFDDPWVNSTSGYLPNDMRHQIKLRGTYALSPHWHIGGSLNAHSGIPITAYGVGNPYDARNYHSYFICVQNCSARSEDRVYEPSPGGRGGYGRLSWIYNLNANITYLREWGDGGQLKAKLAFYNLLNEQRTTWVNQNMQTTISDTTNPDFLRARGFQSARYAALTVSVSF